VGVVSEGRELAVRENSRGIQHAEVVERGGQTRGRYGEGSKVKGGKMGKSKKLTPGRGEGKKRFGLRSRCFGKKKERKIKISFTLMGRRTNRNSVV